MLFISIDDFYKKTRGISTLSRAEEKVFAHKMKSGDITSREKIIVSYLPMAVAHIKRLPDNLQTLELAYRCIHSLEKAVDSFDFLQDSDRFLHRLSWWLRQTVARYIADMF